VQYAVFVDEYRDSSGKRLVDYPRPSVAVDTAVLSVDVQHRLVVVLADSRLPGTFLWENERLADAVQRSLRSKVGIEGLRPQQLQVFDNPRRDERGWVLSSAHVDVVPFAHLGDAGARAVPVAEVSGLRYDHDEIVRLAVEWLRGRYREEPDPAHLLAETFTLRDLQQVHEAVAGRPLMRDSFRRGMERKLRETGELATGVVGKPPRLFSRLPID